MRSLGQRASYGVYPTIWIAAGCGKRDFEVLATGPPPRSLGSWLYGGSYVADGVCGMLEPWTQ